MERPKQLRQALTRVRVPRFAFITAITLGAVLWVLAWAVASPTGSSPDEPRHLGHIWWHAPVATASRQLNPANGMVESLIPEAVMGSACYAFDPSQSGVCTLTLPADNFWWYPPPGVPVGIPFFYQVLSPFVGNSITPTGVYHSVVAMRVFNGLLAIALLAGVCYFLPRSGRRLLCYATIAVAAPMGIFLIASVNPSGWSITGLVVAWFGAYAALRGSTTIAQVVPAGLALIGGVLAATARTDSAIFLAALAVGLVVLHWQIFRAQRWWLVFPAVLFLLGVIGFLAGGQAGAITEGVIGEQNVVGSGRWPTWVLFNNLLQFPEFMLRLPTPPLNWLDTELPQISEITVSIAWVALVLWGWATEKPNWQKWVALAGLLCLIVLLPLYLFQISGLLVGFEIQQRYILPLLPILLAVALWRPIRDGAPHLSRRFTWLLYLALVVGHAAALHTQIRRFTRGLDNYLTRFYTGPRLNVGVEWWQVPVSPDATWLLGSLGFALLALSLFVVREKRNVIIDEKDLVTP